MAWNVFDKISICQLHHVLGAALFGLSAYVLISRPDLVANFVKTLNTTDGKCSLLGPDFYSDNSRVWNFADYRPVCKSLSFLCGKPFFIIFEVSLVGYCLLIRVFDFISGWFDFFFWFFLAFLLLGSKISFDVVFSHFDFELINLILQFFYLSFFLL